MYGAIVKTFIITCRVNSLSLLVQNNTKQNCLHLGSQHCKKVKVISRLCSYYAGRDTNSSIDISRLNCKHCAVQQGKTTGSQIGTSRTLSHNLLNSAFIKCQHSLLRPNAIPMQNVRMFSLQTAVESVTRTQAGWFQSLSESTVVGYAQDFLVSVHDLTGLPWWASIMLTTVFVRTVVTTPLALYQNYILAKVENLQLEMADIVKELKMETAYAVKKYGWTEKHAQTIYRRSLKKQWKQLIVRDNCHPFKASILLWVQLPMWICFSTAMRNLVYMLPQSPAAQVIFLELSVGGFGWIPNLTVPDTSLIIPVTFGLVNMAIIELQVMTRVKQSSKLQRIATNAFRVLSFVMIPVAASVPSCLSLYWTTSSIFGLGQNLLLLSPKIKRVTGIPKSGSQLEQPYKHIADKIRQRAAHLYKPLGSK